MRKDLEEGNKMIYLCIRFRFKNVERQTRQTSSLKYWKGDNIKQQVRVPRRNSDGKITERKIQTSMCNTQTLFYYEEFDPGSGWTLATGLTHASRGASGSSNTLPATGARVSNAYVTCLIQGDSPWKRGLISHGTWVPHGIPVKAPAV